MARNRHPRIEGLHITSLAAEGNAMGKWNDIVVFVPMTVPGDVVNVQIRTKRRRYMEGYVTEYLELSPLRTTPFCAHFGVCGGCKWQNLPYAEQLAFKQQQVADQLTRIGHLELPAISPILGSAKTDHYRNKLEFTFAPRRWKTYEEVARGEEITDTPALGFHIPGMFDKILDIDCCHLQPEPSNEIRNSLRQFCISEGLEFYDIRQHSGLMRNVIIRTASTGQIMVIVVFAYEDSESIDKVMGFLKERFPQVSSLIYMINDKLNDSLGDREPIVYAGADHIVEQMEGLKFKVGPKSFYQTNSEQAYELYKVAREFADLTGGEVVYDLYTGTGTIANFVAAKAAKVVGVEYVEEAIEDAKVNSAINGITNTTFYAGDMKDVMNDQFVEENGRPDVIILDPPRAGVHEDVIATILRVAPERIVYVSCNPATQARDLALMDAQYKIVAVQPVDMFPHTHHVENVVKLIKR